MARWCQSHQARAGHLKDALAFLLLTTYYSYIYYGYTMLTMAMLCLLRTCSTYWPSSMCRGSRGPPYSQTAWPCRRLDRAKRPRPQPAKPTNAQGQWATLREERQVPNMG